jgi:DMSO/TMAO reductase YedYZ molybdopterin-dependent catalytic subunit/thiosulfate reductase cytochrome b subunit
VPDQFPWWVIATHFLNIVFMLLLARSGIEVLSAFPKLYWNDGCPPGREWLRLSKKTFSAEPRQPWSSLSEEESWSPLLALPGRKNLGLGRHWHFLTVQFWILTGAVYITMVLVSGRWRYLVPTDWAIIPDSIRSIGTYLQFRLPDKIPGEPFEPAQKLTYFLVVFVLAPFQIVTGAAMSPAVLARFPRFGRLFGGKQGARSLHFLGLVAFAGFVVLHTSLVIVYGLPKELGLIVLGGEEVNRPLAVVIAAVALLLVVVLNVAITRFSLRHRRRTQVLLGRLVNPMERLLSRTFTSRQSYRARDISAYHRVNGFPPPDEEYRRMAGSGFADYRLDVGGLVTNPVSLSLEELRGLGEQSQTVKHNCIQGWTAVAQWSGVPLAALVERVQPLPAAKHVVFYAMDDKGETEGEGRYGFFYGSVPLHLATQPQSLLALEMNGGPLPVQHGAPVRLRLETQLGFKMVKWIRAIEFVERVDDIGMGQGGWREDQQFYANAAGI